MSVLSRLATVVKHEPALLTTAAGAAVAIGASFGLHLNAVETRELYGGCATLTALVIRQAVTPNSKVPDSGDSGVVERVAALEAAVSELARAEPTIST